MPPDPLFPRRLVLSLLAAAVAVVMLLASLSTPLTAAGTSPAYLSGSLSDSVRAASSYIDARILAAGVAKSVTVPTFADDSKALVVVVFSATCPDYYVNANGTAAEPTVDITDGSGSERNPSALQFYQGATYSVLAPVACKVTLTMHKKRSI